MIDKSNTIIRSKKAPISVIIPTIGRPEYLSMCLLSLVRQKVLPAEVIVVDNSTGGIKNKIKILLEDLSSQMSRTDLKYVREKRRGVSYARNTGINASKYDLFAFIDDDCMANSDWIEKIMQSTTLNPKTIIQGASLNGSPDNIYSCVEYYNTQCFFRFALYKNTGDLYYSNLLDTKNCIIRKSMFKYFPYFDRCYYAMEDVDFAFRVLEKGVKIIFDKKIIVRHFGRTGLLSHLISEFIRGENYYRFQKKWSRKVPIPYKIYGILDKINKEKNEKLRKFLKGRSIANKSIWFRLYFDLILWLNHFFFQIGFLFEKFVRDSNIISIFLPRRIFIRNKRSRFGM